MIRYLRLILLIISKQIINLFRCYIDVINIINNNINIMSFTYK